PGAGVAGALAGPAVGRRGVVPVIAVVDPGRRRARLGVRGEGVGVIVALVVDGVVQGRRLVGGAPGGGRQLGGQPPQRRRRGELLAVDQDVQPRAEAVALPAAVPDDGDAVAAVGHVVEGDVVPAV